MREPIIRGVFRRLRASSGLQIRFRAGPSALRAFILWHWWRFLGREVFCPEQEVDRRLLACQEGCGGFLPESRQCLHCSCFVDLKASLAFESCPKRRWGKALTRPLPGATL